MTNLDYVLLIEQNAIVANPGFVFPYKRYIKTGKDIVMYGDMDKVIEGDVACATLDFPSVPSNPKYARPKPCAWVIACDTRCYPGSIELSPKTLVIQCTVKLRV